MAEPYDEVMTFLSVAIKRLSRVLLALDLHCSHTLGLYVMLMC
jgi:hypothetical protein